MQMCLYNIICQNWAYGLDLVWVTKHNNFWLNSWSLGLFLRQMPSVYVYQGYISSITKIWYYIKSAYLYLFEAAAYNR